MLMALVDRIVQSIKSHMAGTSMTDDFYASVIQRLEGLGYIVNVTNDSWMIAFAIQKVENQIKNACNLDRIPDGLKYRAVDMVCGEFLFAMKQTGKLDETFNLEVAVKSVQAGDTNVTLAIGDGSQSPEQRLDALISYLMERGEGDFVCYQKLKW